MFLQLLLALLIIGILALVIPTLISILSTRASLYPLEKAPAAPVAIVFGAGLQRDGSPTAILQDRVTTAVNLYFSGKVKKLLMSGDNRFVDYNEPGSMRAFAISRGVPEEDIVLDYAGRRTYDTCYRARTIFGIDHALLVSQNYHLPRAIFTCNALGLRVTGISADRRVYRSNSYRYWTLREVPATLVALWEVWVTHPLPVLGDPEPIFPENTVGTNPNN